MRSLTLPGEERIQDLLKNTLTIQRALTYQIDTCSFSLAGDRPAKGEEIIINHDEIRLFAGLVAQVELSDTHFSDSGRLNIWKVDCDDYTPMVDRRLVVETYENMSASDIFLNIAALYCPDFTTSGVQSGAPIVEYIRFDYLHPSECFKQLCEYVGWHWQPTYTKDLQFFSTDTLVRPAPIALLPGGPFRKLKYKIDVQGLRNLVYVLGGTFLSDPQTFEYVADGKERIWVLPYAPHFPLVSVQESEPVAAGQESVDEESGFTWMYSQKEKYIRCANQTPTPIAGATVAFTYQFPMDVITMVEDTASQQALAAAQGGDGIYMHKIYDDSLVTLQAAEAAGQGELRERSNPKVSGSFETEVDGWQPGQLVPIELPDRGISGEYLVQKVKLKPVGSSWVYTVEFGGRLIGLPDILRALVSAQQNKVTVDVKYQTKFESGEDVIGILDEAIITPRTQPWYAGDADAIAGEVIALAVI